MNVSNTAFISYYGMNVQKNILPLADTEVNGIIPIISAFHRAIFTYRILSQLPRKQLALLYLEQADGRVV